MIPELGHFALIVALLLAMVQSIPTLIGAHRGNATLMSLARPAARGQFLFLAIAFACLAYSFVNNDFSVENVARNSFSQLPKIYCFAATWGSHEGSLLLWALILSIWTLAVTQFSRHLPDDIAVRVIGVMGLVSVGFLAFMLITSNPFLRLIPAPMDGQDLNPLLQDPGMVIHPPMLYMGYVGFSVAFAFAIAALLSGKMDAAWARWTRPWTIVAWSFLTVGIVLGSWWAYNELGWGGWWFWDPTENASFMPWLAGTALIHSLAVTEKRGAFKPWTALLAITAFSLSLLGTFLVRSGVLSSVHAFATDPARGMFILAFLGVVIGGSLALYAWRAPRLMVGGSFSWFSRETLLLANNVVLVAALGSVLLGTLYPLLMDAIGVGKISVGPPYFNLVFVPLMAPIFFLIGIGPLARWKDASVPDMITRLRWALGIALACGVLLPFTMKGFNAWVTFGVTAGLWIMLSVVQGFRDRLKFGVGTLSEKLKGLPRSFWGMHVAHFGLALGVIGITLVANYQEEKDVKMAPGDQTELAGYTFTFQGVHDESGPNYRANVGTMDVSRHGKKLYSLNPQKRTYNASGMPMTEAAIKYSLTSDVYISLGDQIDAAGTWAVRVYHKPFVNWLWMGGFLLAIGGMLAATDRRYRLTTKLRTTEIPISRPVAAQEV